MTEENYDSDTEFYKNLGEAINVFAEISFKIRLLDDYTKMITSYNKDFSEISLADMEKVKQYITFQYGLDEEELLSISRNILNRYPMKSGERSIKNKF